MQKVTMIAALAVVLAGCATQPVGPTVRVLPAPYKPFEVFQRDQADCENYAGDQVKGGVQSANNHAVGAAAIGAALGLAVGAETGNGRAATTGLVAGGAVGSAVGANESERSQYGIQRRYDIAYAQCMYARGNQVPGFRPQGAPPPPRRGGPPPGYNNLPPDGYGPPPGRGAPPPDEN